jgi:hypothetical protein
MIKMYCKGNHKKDLAPCNNCRELFDYASHRIINCKLGDSKTTCARCKTHCFKPEFRQRIRQVMRYSGPRMFFRHPYLAILHLFDSADRS